LGNIDLKRRDYLDIEVKTIHRLLISWDTIPLADNARVVPRDDLDRAIRQSIDEVRDLGVEHRDLCPENVL
jgi:hypothetical protein